MRGQSQRACPHEAMSGEGSGKRTLAEEPEVADDDRDLAAEALESRSRWSAAWRRD